MGLDPIYTLDNCSWAYQLNWTVSVFGQSTFPDLAPWLEAVEKPLEQDAVRILEGRLLSSNVATFLLSTKPSVSPARLLQVLKGRLQYAVRATHPRVFRRNYRIESVGSAKREVIERYVNRQFERHPMADSRVQQRLAALQLTLPDIDLSCLRYSAHGQYIYNLHLVLEHEKTWADFSEDLLTRTVSTIRGVATKKELLLKGAGIVSNHLHCALGCQMAQAPAEVALWLLNNLAFANGMLPIYKFGFYVGTFGNFDLNAIRNANLAAAVADRQRATETSSVGWHLGVAGPGS